jgi:hypothetical protein
MVSLRRERIEVRVAPLWSTLTRTLSRRTGEGIAGLTAQSLVPIRANSDGGVPLDENSWQAEIITVGREILTGRTLDTNAHWLAQQLSRLGGSVRRIVIADDDPAARSELVI